MSHDIKAYNRELLIKEARSQMVDYLIKTSRMVEEGKLSSTGAKQVAGYGIDRYNKALKIIEEICK